MTKRTVLIVVIAAVIGAGASFVVRAMRARQRPQVSEAEARRQAHQHLLVQPGTDQQAKDYYTRISKGDQLGFAFEGSTLDALLAYMGYAVPTTNPAVPFTGLVAKDIEQIPSFALMPRSDAEFAALKVRASDPEGLEALLDPTDFSDDRVLAARFFAPKIATYFDSASPSQPINPDDIVPGWRKLVRLTARSGSAAERAGILHMYLLFNVKQKDPEADPFVVESANNQVILVPRDEDKKDSAYFAVYGTRTDGYKLSLFLAADFDLPGHVGVEVPGASNGKYFVPRSCAECHGHSDASGLRGRPIDVQGQPTEDFKVGRFPFAKSNYLDTDQWYDWMEFDFRGVTTSLRDVVFDGGKNHGSGDYVRAMDVIRKLNASVRDQTFAAERTRGVKSFQTLAAEKWLALHDGNPQRAPYAERSIGTEHWDSTSRDEMRLLRLLDNHCFRCHSSVIYNVFDRAGVKAKKDLIPVFLKLPLFDDAGNPLPGFRMPQGRVLKIEERDEIVRLVSRVFP